MAPCCSNPSVLYSPIAACLSGSTCRYISSTPRVRSALKPSSHRALPTPCLRYACATQSFSMFPRRGACHDMSAYPASWSPLLSGIAYSRIAFRRLISLSSFSAKLSCFGNTLRSRTLHSGRMRLIFPGAKCETTKEGIDVAFLVLYASHSPASSFHVISPSTKCCSSGPCSFTPLSAPASCEWSILRNPWQAVISSSRTKYAEKQALDPMHWSKKILTQSRGARSLNVLLWNMAGLAVRRGLASLFTPAFSQKAAACTSFVRPHAPNFSGFHPRCNPFPDSIMRQHAPGNRFFSANASVSHLFAESRFFPWKNLWKFGRRLALRLVCASSFVFGYCSQASVPPMRNIAVIAHVDHGKTTLVDKLMQECRLHTSHSTRFFGAAKYTGRKLSCRVCERHLS